MAHTAYLSVLQMAKREAEWAGSSSSAHRRPEPVFTFRKYSGKMTEEAAVVNQMYRMSLLSVLLRLKHNLTSRNHAKTLFFSPFYLMRLSDARSHMEIIFINFIYSTVAPQAFFYFFSYRRDTLK